MKKIIYAMAAMAMVFASCSEMDFEDGFGGVTRNVKLNVTVADLGTDEPATRAKIKNDWAKDDQIEIYLDDNTDKAFMLTYDGSKWTGPETINGTPNTSGGYVKALYNGQVIVASKDNYSYDSATSTLTFSIQNWKFLTQIQVVVDGITGDASNYTLACDKFTPLSSDKYTVGADAITVTMGEKGAAATGFESATNSGAATFVFATADYTTGESTDNYAFTLIRTSSIKERVSFSVNKAFASSDSKTIKAIKLAYDKFQHESVQLWADGPKWATCNVGATSPEEYGDHFAWGEVAPYYTESGGWSTSTTWGGTSTKKTGYDWTNYCGSSSFTEWSTKPYDETSKVLKSTYDAARANWGDGWRMPTQTDFSNLLSKCDWSWTTQGGENGYKVTGKETGYTDKSIFLPAAGYRNGTSFINGGTYGYYWSSSLITSSPSNADGLYIYSSFHTSNSTDRRFGRTVRPVSD